MTFKWMTKFNKRFLFVCTGLLGATISDMVIADTVTITQPITIAEANTSYDNRDVVISGTNVVINGSHHFQSLKLLNSSITHDVEKRIDISVSGLLEINNSTVDITGKGLLADSFSGAPSGGSHAGIGDAPEGSFAGLAYGDFQAPVALGQGGRDDSGLITEATSNRGGGAIKLVADEIHLSNASIMANGANTATYAAGQGAGAGGSIWLDANKLTLENSIYITANGGWADNGGAGGRISFSYNQINYAGSLTDANSPFNVQAVGSGMQDDSASGTIFTRNKLTQSQELYIGRSFGHSNEKHYTPVNVPNGTKLITERSAVALMNSTANFSIQAYDSVLTFINDVTSLNVSNSSFSDYTKVVFQKDVALANSLPGKQIYIGGVLSAQNGELGLTQQSVTFKKSQTYNALTLTNSHITVDADSQDRAVPLVLTAQHISLDSNSSIDVSGKGSSIPQINPNDSLPDIAGDYDSPAAAGVAFDSVGSGGGAVKIVADDMTLDGNILADSSGGNGGSIWLDVGTLTAGPDAFVSASGKNGGRVAIHYNNSINLDTESQIAVAGERLGTLYVKNKNAAAGLLSVKSNSAPSSLSTHITVNNPQDNFVFTNANVSFTNPASFTAGSTFNNAVVRVPSILDWSQLPAMENTTLYIQNDADINSLTLSAGQSIVFEKNLTLHSPLVGDANAMFSVGIAGTLEVPNNDLTVDGFTLELLNNQTFNNVYIKNGGVITTGTPSTLKTPLITLAAQHIDIDESSKIDVTGKGLEAAEGVGFFHGASHGGFGGDNYRWFGSNYAGPVGATYGNQRQPTSFGRGAKTFGGSSYGGGAIKIVADSLNILGTIAANGQPQLSENMPGGGASGGSIWIDVNALTLGGHENIRADGSDCSLNNGVYTGGGGGGRIAIYYTSMPDFDTETFSTWGGRCFSNNVTMHGGPGTVFLSNKNDTSDQWLQIIGSQMDEDTAKTGAIDIDSGLSLYMHNTRFSYSGNVHLANAIIINSQVNLNGNLDASGWENIIVSDIKVSGDFTGTGTYVTASNLNVSGNTNFTSFLTITDSTLQLKQYSEIRDIYLSNSTVDFLSDVKLWGSVKLLNSTVRITGNLDAESAIVMGQDTSDVSIAHAFFNTDKNEMDFHYLNANGQLSSLTEASSQEERDSTRFRLVRGLADQTAVSFESVTQPGYYLVNAASQLAFQPNNHTASFANAATFRFSAGGNTLLESVSTPGQFVGQDEQGVVSLSADTGEGAIWQIKRGMEDIDLNSKSAIRVGGNVSVGDRIQGFGFQDARVWVGNQLHMNNGDATIDGASVFVSKNHTFGNLNIINAGVLGIPSVLEVSENARQAGLEITANNVVIDEKSKIDLSAKERYQGLILNTGGSHGGRGGSYDGVESYPTYGDMEQPTTVGGSGSGDINSRTLGGSALKLTAQALDLNGSILSNGQAATDRAGGAAGGSIWLIVDNLISSAGTGQIHADGGDALNQDTSAGGGGRIAIFYKTLSGLEDGNLSARGGAQGVGRSQPGGDGTIYKVAAGVPPFITNVDTSALTNQSVQRVHISFSSAIDAASFSPEDVVVTNANQQTFVPISVTALSDTQFEVSFSPALVDGTYHMVVGPNIVGKNGLALDQNRNLTGGESDDTQRSDFVVDTTAPQVTVLDDYPLATGASSVLLSGSKEPGSTLLINGVEVYGTSNHWSHLFYLLPGMNTFEFVIKDAAGNYSLPTTASIFYDNVAPGPVDFTVSGKGSGKEVSVDWSGYDEAKNGQDIDSFQVYVSTSNYSSTSQATLVTSVPRYLRSYTLTGLTPGQTYFVSVVAKDLSGLVNNEVTALPVIPTDTNAPTGLANLKVIPDFNKLSLSWTPVNNVDGDFDHYNVTYFDKGQPKTLIINQSDVGSANPVSYELGGLVPATAYNILVSAVDTHGNTSAGLSNPGVTLLPNPLNLQAEGANNSAQLSWSPVSPSALLYQYAVYVQATPFTSVTGLTPALKVSKWQSSTTVPNLVNGTKVYVAVTSVNNSYGEYQEVQSIGVTPQEDKDGPIISEALYWTNNTSQNLTGSSTLTYSGKIAIKASDKSKMSRVVFALDNEPISTVLITNSVGAYEQPLDMSAIPDGSHVIGVDAYDTLENVTHKDYPVTVDMAAPPAPVFTSPSQNSTTNQKVTTLTGTAELGTKITLFKNDVLVSQDINTDGSGKFTAPAELTEGLNKFVARAQYQSRTKVSGDSAARNITLNTQIPNAPGGVTATGGKQGQVFLAWSGVSNTAVNQIKGYNVYRASTSFSSIGDAGVERLNNQAIITTSFADVVATDGTYYYAVTAVNQADTESALSAVVSATADSKGPRITEITYVSNGKVDATSGRMGVGVVQVSATFSEPLRNAPYFAIVPDKGVPIAVELTKNFGDDTKYTGKFQITPSTPSGTAYAVMSAYDNAGNRGTDMDQGTSINIDTQGPDVSELLVTPADPLKVDEQQGLQVSVSLKLNDETANSEMPKFVPLINGVAVAGYSQGVVLTRKADSAVGAPVWSGSFNLPNTTASNAQATLSFDYLAQDDLTNSSSKINGASHFQVYQGNLPPLAIPADLSATAQPGGKVKLAWRLVDKAVSYIIYRQGTGDAAPTEIQRVNVGEYIDSTPTDGTYLYAVASVRNDNGQEASSAKSPTVSVQSDRIAPAAPQHLALELNGAGIVSRWDAPTLDAHGGTQVTEGLTYNLYRVALAKDVQLHDLTGLAPIQTKIPALLALDAKPSTNEHSYVVTAVDAAGNESIPSETVYLNFGLLPVNELNITLVDGGYPKLSWQDTATSVKTYKVMRRVGDEDPLLLTPEGITHTGAATSYEDITYNGNQVSHGAGQEVVYSVIAMDDNTVESPAHELRLPAIAVHLEKTAEVAIERGIMNKLMFRVDNKGKTVANKLRLYVSFTENGALKVHQSDDFSLDANSSTLVPVVVGGYSKLDGLVDLSLRVEQQPQTNEKISIFQSESVQVGNSSLTASLDTQEFTRGGSGKASFTITNTSDVETELVLARSGGNADSNELRLVLEDLQGNVLNQQPIRQFTGGVINVAGDYMVARIAPKASFTSSVFSINVPSAAPDQVKLRLMVDKYHYHLGQASHVVMNGVGVSKDVVLSDTPYFATVDNVSAQVLYAKDDTLTVSGHVTNRATNQPALNVPVSLIYSVRGFETKSTVYSDSNGQFSSVYKSDGVPGKYRISAVHPAVTDRPNNGEFIVEGGSVGPLDMDLKIPRNYVQKIPLRIEAGFESTITNLHLVPLASGTSDIPQLPAGISLTYDPVQKIDPNNVAYLNINFSGDNSAAESGLLSYRVEADNHTGAAGFGILNISYKLLQASPAISAKPTYIDSGVGLGAQIVEDLKITNSGLDKLPNATVELATKDNSALPSWISLNTLSALGDLAVGEERPIQIVIKPESNTPEGEYEFKLQVKGDNFAGYSIPVFIKVTQSGRGGAFFHASDIYTATLDANKNRIEGLNKTTIKLQNENVLSEVYSLDTDSKGEATFENIPAGRYTYRASAFDHDSISGRVWVKPGVTTSQEIFLVNNLINVEWSVREITVEDRYEIKLDATFKTQVPIAVVMLSPLSVQLPVMKQGDVFQGEFTLTNHGLIRADNVKQILPASNNLVRFEFLKEVPNSLEAGEVFVMPYRVQALVDFDPVADAFASGGGCGSFNANTSVSYESTCAQGTTVPGSTTGTFNSNWGSSSCGGSTGGPGSSGSWVWQPGSAPPGSSYSGAGAPLGKVKSCGSKDPNKDSCDSGNGSPQ